MNHNPFTPNFGQVPTQMAGRAEIVERMQRAFEDGIGNPDLCTLFKGARGTGKTALLLYLAREAERHGWIAVSATAVPGMLEDLYEQALRKTAEIADLDGQSRIRGISVGQLFGIEWDVPETPSLNWRSRMTALLEALGETGAGLLMTVDEADPDLDELVQLATVYQHFVGEDRKVSLLMAGLPHRISSLLRGKSISFLRRANQMSLGRIPRAEVEDAFEQTAAIGGKTVSRDAVSAAADAIDGFPFMMQLVGYRSWDASGESASIDTEDVSRGLKLARSDMENRVLSATLDELSSRDLEVLACLLEADGPVGAPFIAKRTGMSSGNVSTYRKRLLEQGVVEETGRGGLRFGLPMLREYLPRYLDENAI